MYPLRVSPIRVRAVKTLPVVRERPACRSECRDLSRPCPYVTCRYHLLVDIGSDGRLLKMREFDENDPDSIAAAIEEMDETCALDVADRGGVTSVRVADLVGIRRQGVEEIISEVGAQLDRDDFEERDHPEDFYIRYSRMGADELSEIAAELRRRGKK